LTPGHGIEDLGFVAFSFAPIHTRQEVTRSDCHADDLGPA